MDEGTQVTELCEWSVWSEVKSYINTWLLLILLYNIIINILIILTMPDTLWPIDDDISAETWTTDKVVMVKFMPTNILSKRVRQLFGVAMVAGWVTLTGSGAVNGVRNIHWSHWGYEEPANTLLTDLRGVQKIDRYDTPAYRWDENSWLYDGYDITRDGIKSDGFIDNLVWWPWNFSIFIWWLMIAGIGVLLTKEKKRSLELKMTEALRKGEKVSFSDWKDTLTFQFKQDGNLEIQKNDKIKSVLVYSIEDRIKLIINMYNKGTIMDTAVE